MTQEQSLLYRLMRNYDRASRPVFDASKPVNIKVGISLTQILDIDEKNQVLTINVWLDQDWNDERLVWWNMSEFSSIKKLRIPCDLIWLPDIVLYNSVDSHKEYMKALAMVDNDGHVFWPPIVRMRSSCKMDITFFPFDDQVCHLKLGSWAYDGFQVDVSNRTMEIDLTNFVDNGEWTLVDTRVVRNVIYYPCCPEPFPDVTFYIQLRRRVLYYLLNVIIPCMLLSMLTLASFCLPPDSGEKVTLGLTVLLAFSVFMLLVAENMPPTSEYVPLIGVYLTIIMGMSALSVVFSVFVLNFHHKTSIKNPPPRWAKKMAAVAAAVTFSKATFCTSKMSTKSSKPTQSDQMTKEQKYSTAFHTEPKAADCTESEACQSLLSDVQSPLRCGSNPRNGGFLNGESRDPNGRTSSIVERVIIDYVSKVIAGYDRQSLESETLNDWKEVARIIDRVLFVLFFLVTVVSTVVTLIFMPTLKNTTIDDYIAKRLK
ncbi:acetylcholine receptor subunit alpha-type acr-16-like [Dreissena polymorpha]|nr:acetylcholine receptor subunit alpha-type acr-16-like [Dreissena polymorpha]